MFKVNTKNTRMSSCRSGVFIVNFEHISHLFFSVSIVDLEQINVCWEATWGLRLDRIENNKKVWCNENALFPVLAPVKMKLYETNGNLFWKYQFLKFVKYKGTSSTNLQKIDFILGGFVFVPGNNYWWREQLSITTFVFHNKQFVMRSRAQIINISIHVLSKMIS